MGANYINLKLDPAKGLFNYEVKFNPDIDSRPLRRKLLNQHVQALGRTKVFDGVTLYLPQKLKQDVSNENQYIYTNRKDFLKFIKTYSIKIC